MIGLFQLRDAVAAFCDDERHRERCATPEARRELMAMVLVALEDRHRNIERERKRKEKRDEA